MISALYGMPDGRTVLVIGLSADDVRLLQDDGAGVVVPGERLGAAFDLQLICGETDSAITARMTKHGLPLPVSGVDRVGELLTAAELAAALREDKP